MAVNADVDQLDVILIPEQDDRVDPAGIKGLGELGNVGTAAALANAVHLLPGSAFATCRFGSTNFAPERLATTTPATHAACGIGRACSRARDRAALQAAQKVPRCVSRVPRPWIPRRER